MAIFSIKFVVGVVVVSYLSSYVAFAIIRVLTGVYIRQLGLRSLRGLACSPRDGLSVTARRLGIQLHRPTITRPTWISLVLSDLAILVAPDDLNNAVSSASHTTSATKIHDGKAQESEDHTRNRQHSPEKTRTHSKRWQKLTKLKDRIKRLHRSINLLKLVDVVVTNASITVLRVGKIQIASLTMGIDTRREMVDRSRVLAQGKKASENRAPAEWRFVVRSVLFTPEERDSYEVLDYAILNINGTLYKELDGLRDAAVSLKLGRLQLPLDDIKFCMQILNDQKSVSSESSAVNHESISVADIMVELDRPGSQDAQVIQTVSESKEFFHSILRGIKEVQLAIGFVCMSSKITSVQTGKAPLYISASMKELGIDLHRLDSRAPAHRMYFSPKDVAHEALAAALSITIGIDEGENGVDRLLYIPMATATLKTTLPAKTVEIVMGNSADERNTNMLYANCVVTSPSVDLRPKHLPILMAMSRPSASPARKQRAVRKQAMISRLLPKTHIKFSMHEPVLRLALPAIDPAAHEDDFDLIISSISSISLDVESSHSAKDGEVRQLHYNLDSALRIQSHSLYYQTSTAIRHDLLQIESMDLKVQVNASPDVHVVASGTLQTFALHMVRPEISEGVRLIVKQLRTDVEPTLKGQSKSQTHPNFVRAMPPWLLHLQFQASDFSIQVAGVDADISESTRGVAMQLETWAVEYRGIRAEVLETHSQRSRAGSRPLRPDVAVLEAASETASKDIRQSTDGRRLTLNVRGLESFVVEAADELEAESFLSLPKFDVTLATSSDKEGPIFNASAAISTVLVQYSLYRHYAIGVAAMVLRKSFMKTKADEDEFANRRATQRLHLPKNVLSPLPSPSEQAGDDRQLLIKELITVDFSVALLQVKAKLPADPLMMLHVYGVQAGRHRWTSPFAQANLVRLYVEAPKMQHVWARILSLKQLEVVLRKSKKRSSRGELQEQNHIDVNAGAIRLAIPHQLVFHTVVDNIVNTIKATAQLHHRFNTGTNDYILTKHPEGPKLIPKISVRTKALLFEVEDGAFEWRLGMIYKTGLIEQRQRLARDDAFRVKARKVAEDQQQSKRPSSRPRNRSTHTQRSKRSRRSRRGDGSDDETPVKRGRGRTKKQMRYDPEGQSTMSGTCNTSVDAAKEKLQLYNSQSWKKRIDHAYATQGDGMKILRGVFWGADELPDDLVQEEEILEVPQRPGLMGILFSNVHVMIDKPSFPMYELPDFMHRIGKGMPRDMQYGLLVPLHIKIAMGETRMSLRDYPLPLLHVPALKQGQSSKLPSWTIETDFVIAEEFRGPESVRHVKVEIVPPQDPRPNNNNKGQFAIDVARTVSPVKTYSDLHIDVNTALPTRITWGASYQPAIQDMMMVIEGFTKPQRDPSDRTGFWDKTRLSFHSRVLVSWKHEGEVHFVIKGSRDPYLVTGDGAGFVMCWRRDVIWSIWRENDPKKFMTVDAAEFDLAIPDFSHQARGKVKNQRDNDTIATPDHHPNYTSFKKVVMKLNGRVQWLAGLMFEQDLENGKRSFDFAPHYDVVLKEPEFARAPQGKTYDAFRGFRSHHIHLSIAVAAPVDRDWSTSNTATSRSYNTVHLTPRFFSHFYAWWAMFGGTMSLPIRQGRLWPGIEKSSKKFGRHLATIKYNLLLAPLFMSHIYKHKDAEDYADDIVSATGLKLRLDSFMLDIHQRREEFSTQDKGRKTPSKTTGMKIHKAQLDLLNADIRAISASIAGTTRDDMKCVDDDKHDGVAFDESKFEIPDNDFSWIDMDDFTELDWILPQENTPHTKIMPLGFAPRVTYFRQTDHGDTISGDPDRKSSFGHEPTHNCIMSTNDDPRIIQCRLIKDRLKQLKEQKDDHTKETGEAELRYLRDNGRNPLFKTQFDDLVNFEHRFHDKTLFLESMLHRMDARVHMAGNGSAVPAGGADREADGVHTPASHGHEADGMDSKPAEDYINDFNNRFVIHNMQLKWNNSLRNTIIRYIHQVSQRRGFVYYLSRRAVKFILDIIDEQGKSKTGKQDQQSEGDSKRHDSIPGSVLEPDVDAHIEDVIAEARKFVKAGDASINDSKKNFSAEHLTANIGEGYLGRNSYYMRLIAPQIQLQSEKNDKSLALITAKGMEAKIIEVMDKERLFDDVSGLVQRRFSITMDSTQFFVTQKKWFSTQHLSMYTTNRYGTAEGAAWPPWVPYEAMFEFEIDPFGFKRIVQRTSANLRYEKYNTLRLKYNDEIETQDNVYAAKRNAESRVDHLWIEFPQIRAICDSEQYYALYSIVMDLLLYSEPLEKKRSERLEKIMLASDFSDLRGTPELVIKLQDRIRQLDEIKTQFQINSKALDTQGWDDRIVLEQDLTSCEDELFFMMKAITTSQQKYDGDENTGLLKWNIRAQQIVWHLIREMERPLIEFQLENAQYDRTDNSDGSHVNLMQIGKVVGLNLLPDALYPDMIAPYADSTKGASQPEEHEGMLSVFWCELEAIAGITVMEKFEAKLHPMKIQLEREVGKKLFEYIFPDKKENGKGKHSGAPRPMQAMDEDDEVEPSHTMPITGPERLSSNASDTRAGSLESRLKPTITSEYRSTSGSGKAKSTHSSEESSPFNFFKHRKDTKAWTAAVKKKASTESLRSMASTRAQSLSRTMTNASSQDTASTHSDGNRTKRLFHRSSKNDTKPSDDLTQMMNRASEYKTLGYVRIPSVVLCLSYKGKGERNIEDVHSFVFRLPQLEYRNKTWSNMDLANAVKKDVIKALLSHTGSIIGNKFSRHRPSATQQSKLRDLANSSVVLASSNGWDREGSIRSDSSSMLDTSTGERDTSWHRSRSPRSSHPSEEHSLARASSRTSSSTSLNELRAPPTATQSRYDQESSLGRASKADETRPGSGDGSTHDQSDTGKSGFMNDTKLGRKLHAFGDKLKGGDANTDASPVKGGGGNSNEGGAVVSKSESEEPTKKKGFGRKLLDGLGEL